MEVERARKNENLEVTGVSRSGRVRKKSSKLTDFESPDEFDTKHKRKIPEPSPRLEKPRKIVRTPKSKPSEDDEEHDFSNQMFEGASSPQGGESDSEGDIYKPEPDDDGFEGPTDDEDDDDDDDDYVEGQLVVDEKTPNQSLYISEKAKKRVVVLKDGKVVVAHKAIRRDKGKSRFTAYMMWSKEVRKALSKQFPSMDFTTMARRLSELWATVPKAEREHWKRKAKKEGLKKTKAKAEAPLMPSRKFINKKGGPIAPLMNTPPVQPQKTPPTEISPTKTSPRKPTTEVTPVGYVPPKNFGIEPINIAAHLKLLGESLSVIGGRLQEHEGQIAVSGSMSVLLDSLLCSMGPLVCLTYQIPELNLDEQLLTNILNTSGYLMPGLG